MPVIVDANVAAETFCSETSPYKKVLDELWNGIARMSYGGQLLDEYARMPEVRRAVLALDRAGKAELSVYEDVETETARLRACKSCRSDDEHIIALAKIGKARLLCSKDHLLHQDFKDPALISKPRGKIYQPSVHKELMRTLGK